MDRSDMTPSEEELSLIELTDRQAEVHQSSRAIRQELRDLVNLRLAGKISLDHYSDARTLAQRKAEECRQAHLELGQEIRFRRGLKRTEMRERVVSALKEWKPREVEPDLKVPRSWPNER